MGTLERIEARLRAVYGGRRWILTGDHLTSCTRRAATLHELGAEAVFSLGGSRGSGDIPDPPAMSLGATGTDMMSALRAAHAALYRPGPEVEAAVASWDPERRAMALVDIVGPGSLVDGRRIFDARPAGWCALEDKLAAEPIWDAVGVPRAPAEVVPLTREATAAAGERLDRGDGVVWALDAREGFHGGAGYVRWVRTAEDAEDALAHLSPWGDAVRVMPFLPGIPCSIAGFVLQDGVAVGRPCELVVLLDRDRRFRYAGTGTTWDPPDADRGAMRDVARRVGRWLAREHAYRGCFVVDGLLTVDGFRPTELNPRVGGSLYGTMPGLPVQLFHGMLVAGEGAGVSASELEHWWVRTADEQRYARGLFVVDRVLEDTTLRRGTWRDGWVVGDEGEALVMVGPGGSGGFAMVAP